MTSWCVQCGGDAVDYVVAVIVRRDDDLRVVSHCYHCDHAAADYEAATIAYLGAARPSSAERMRAGLAADLAREGRVS